MSTAILIESLNGVKKKDHTWGNWPAVGGPLKSGAQGWCIVSLVLNPALTMKPL
ncbi:hypothetical protein DPMN_145198 [Dreissena polymorpha]|uniref:Uncharacterized protein n=1 Tax=Dreissena polymorpha TaxID=45954 RepID=A0A9D4F3I3_DREPO|nr:hypothetical protein DPMN_145198 [Dreissena polymorpha]